MEWRKLTLEEVGDLLIQIGEHLKSSFSQRVTADTEPSKRISQQERKRRFVEVNEETQMVLGILGRINRSEAEERLKALPLKKLVQVCRLLGILGVGKAPKEEVVRRILYHCYDFAIGRATLEQFILKSPEEVLSFNEARAFFNSRREELVKRYQGRYIAILNNEVVDTDEDFSCLAERVYRKYGYRDIYMPKVELQEPVINIPTPFVEQ